MHYNQVLEVEFYNGFPLALAMLGDTSTEIVTALHRHFNTRDRLHNALSAFAAWKLNPNDSDAIALLRRELTASDNEVHARYALLDTFGLFGTDASPFLPEVRALTRGDIPVNYQSTSAKAAWRLLKDDQPAKTVIRRFGATAITPAATPEDVNRFAATALELAEVPGVPQLAVPPLKELSDYSEASAARFASNILARLQSRVAASQP